MALVLLIVGAVVVVVSAGLFSLKAAGLAVGLLCLAAGADLTRGGRE